MNARDVDVLALDARDADRDGDRELVALVLERLVGDEPADLLAERARAGDVGLGQDRGELLAAVAREQLLATDAAEQPARHLAQHVVAGEVAVLVVDRLEVIDVEHQQRQRPAVARAARDLALEELEEVALVVGAGQGVHDRHLVDLFVVARLDAGAR